MSIHALPHTKPDVPAGTVVNLSDGSSTIHYIPQTPYHLQRTTSLPNEVSGTVGERNRPSATSEHKTSKLYNSLSSSIPECSPFDDLSNGRHTNSNGNARDASLFENRTHKGATWTDSVQILDYNLKRFDIKDRKGLEIVILTALLTFQDASNATMSASAAPAPAPKKGIARIAELQLGRGQVKVTVLEEGAITDYAKHCAQLLKARSSDPNQVSKALHVVETKRLRH
ncbi:hypothetical protein EV363DRAFT_1585440 [Boletus edulis]|nr:hypothetical protein EV363DRAFT_1585440 [Boletus edulis]